MIRRWSAQIALLLGLSVCVHSARADLGDLRLRLETSAFQQEAPDESTLGGSLGAELALGLNTRSSVHLRSSLSYTINDPAIGLEGSPQVLAGLGIEMIVDRIPDMEPWIFAELLAAYAPDSSYSGGVEKAVRVGAGLGLAIDFRVHRYGRLGLVARYSVMQAVIQPTATGEPVSQISVGLRLGAAVDTPRKN